MTRVRTLTKKGTVIEYEVVEGVRDIFSQMNGYFSQDEYGNSTLHCNRDYLLLTCKDGKQLIINKRFIHVIVE